MVCYHENIAKKWSVTCIILGTNYEKYAKFSIVGKYTNVKTVICTLVYAVYSLIDKKSNM